MIRKTIVLFIMMLVLFPTFLSINSSAHPPGYVHLSYSEEKLRVLVFHFSIAPFNLHHVYRIEIEKNNTPVIQENYNQQNRLFILMYEYNLSVEKGDMIKATAFCSLFGQRSNMITI